MDNMPLCICLYESRMLCTKCVATARTFTSHLCFQTMSPKEKGKFEDLAKQDKVRYEREMMSYVPARGGKKKKFKDPNAPKRPP